MSEKILVPVLGESITEATVAKWLKNKGETVDADEPIVELETDKVNLEVPAPVTGKLVEINSQDGSTVKVGEILGFVTEIRGEIKKSNEIKKIQPSNFQKNEEPKEKDNIKANNKKISYIGRSPDASPATGYAKRHISQQQEIIKKVFE